MAHRSDGLARTGNHVIEERGGPSSGSGCNSRDLIGSGSVDPVTIANTWRCSEVTE